jgi:hypothetical protein
VVAAPASSPAPRRIDQIRKVKSTAARKTETQFRKLKIDSAGARWTAMANPCKSECRCVGRRRHQKDEPRCDQQRGSVATRALQFTGIVEQTRMKQAAGKEI